MKTEETEHLRCLVRQFFDGCGDRYSGVDGIVPRSLSDLEGKMLSGLLTQTLSPREKILVLSADLDWDQCYCLVFLGMRLAVHAVRKSEIEIFRVSLLSLIAGLAGIDWRDQLMMPGAYVICANRLGVDFSSEFSAIVEGLGDLNLDQSVEECLTQDFSSTHYKDYGEGEEYLIY